MREPEKRSRGAITTLCDLLPHVGDKCETRWKEGNFKTGYRINKLLINVSRRLSYVSSRKRN